MSNIKAKYKKRAFLEAFRACANIGKAATAAHIHRDSHYKWLKLDAEYAAAFEDVRIQTAEVLEDEAVRRAHEGVVEPIFYKGRPTAAIRKYSDALLMFLLKGFLPEKYADKRPLEVSGVDGAPILIADKQFEGFSDEDLAKFVELSRKLEAAKENPK